MQEIELGAKYIDVSSNAELWNTYMDLAIEYESSWVEAFSLLIVTQSGQFLF